MQKEIIIAGFGGQGVLLAGKILAQAAVFEGKNATYFPSYGAEMRGGTANCTVIVSDERIDSPVVARPGAVAVFNNPSLERFEEAVAPDGLLLVNSSMIERKTNRPDLKTFYIPATEIARELGDERVFNMIFLGGYAQASEAVSMESLKKALARFFGEKRAKALEINALAFEAGATAVNGATEGK